MTDEQKTPRLKLVSKNDYEAHKVKYAFFNEAKEAQLVPIIAAAAPSDVLALTVTPGSGLQIHNVQILNENTEELFLKLLKEGAGEIQP